MQDLTTGSVTRQLLTTAGFALAMMVVQTLYFLVDLYWVGHLGTRAVAAVGLAGNLSFLGLAVGQVLGAGTTARVAHAVGRGDLPAARHLARQALGLGAVAGALVLAVGLAVRGRYVGAMSADPATARLAAAYLRWFIPALALQLPMGVMGAALRATGQFRPGVRVTAASVVVNLALAPALMFGWGTGRPLGVAGAALASLVAVAGAVAWLAAYVLPAHTVLGLRRTEGPGGWRPSGAAWRQILAVGLPAGFEFAMMALYQAVGYAVARPFGAPAQAGFGVGLRVVQAGFLPVVALALAAAPLAAQNVGANRPARVRAVFRQAAALAAALMGAFALLSLLAADALVGAFAREPLAAAVGADYVRVMAWTHVAAGVAFVASSLFQALGDARPSLVASGARMALLAGLVGVLARRPGFALHDVWLVAAGTLWAQFALSLALLRRAFRRRLGPDVAEVRWHTREPDDGSGAPTRGELPGPPPAGATPARAAA